MPEVPRQRHPNHWHHDGSMVFQVEDVTYRLHLSILQKLSPVFTDLLTIPHAVTAEAAPQGTEEDPIRFLGIEQEAFDDFLMWIYKITWTQPANPERVYINLLKVCQMWQIDEGVAYAVHHLENMVMPSSCRIQLARMFSVHDWVRPAIEALLQWELSAISEQEADNLGLRVYSIIAKACEMLERERKLTAAYPPPMTFDPSWECETHQMVCITIWRDFWWKKVAKQLLNPAKLLAFRDVSDFVEKELKGPKLTASCRTSMIDKVRGMGFMEQQIVDGAVEAVIAFHKTLQ